MLCKVIIAVNCNSRTKPTNIPWDITQSWTVQQLIYQQLPLVFRSVIHEHLSNTYTVPPPTLYMGQSESTLLFYSYCWYCCSDLTLLAGNKQVWLYYLSNLCRCCTHTVWLGLSRDASRLSTSKTSGLSLCMCTVYQTYLNFVTVFYAPGNISLTNEYLSVCRGCCHVPLRLISWPWTFFW